MKKRIYFSFFVCLSYLNFFYAQTVRVSLFNNKIVKSLTLESDDGDVNLIFDDSIVVNLPQKKSILIRSRNNKLDCRIDSNLFFIKTINLNPSKNNSSTSLRINNESKVRRYKGSFEIYVNSESVKLINIPLLKDYLEGVIESESGHSQNLEYYKVQAIISRTYALKNKNRHSEGPFDLCDDVHCQAYFHQGGGNDRIVKSILETRDEILVDSLNNFFTIFFHSNCGGQTTKTESVWTSKVAGYSSVIDTFCLNSSQAHWIKQIHWKDWKVFLESTYFLKSFKDYSENELKHFDQSKRKTFLFDSKYGIPLNEIRDRFKLKSTFFSVSKQGNYVILKGRGFGHGVGVCQQGAMQMSKKYTYKEILNYYLPKAKLLKRNRIIW